MIIEKINKNKKMVLGIYGAGGLGREVFELACVINEKNEQWSEIIFIDDDADNVNNHRALQVLKFSDIENNDIEFEYVLNID